MHDESGITDDSVIYLFIKTPGALREHFIYEVSDWEVQANQRVNRKAAESDNHRRSNALRSPRNPHRLI